MQILQLTIRAREPEALFRFYTQTLGLQGSAGEKGVFTLQAGRTDLRIAPARAQHYYHFAFNIPHGQIETAADWLRKRVELLDDGGQQIIDFSNWNAKALYFLDPAGNIVEFIARRDRGAEPREPFSAEALSEVSEIGLPVDDVGAAFRDLSALTGVPHFWGDSPDFLAAGDHHGLFIIVDRGEKTWYPSEAAAVSAPLEMVFENDGRTFELMFREGEVKIREQAY